MHSQCPYKTEWSGLLIYKIEEGTIEAFTDPKNEKAYLELKAEALYPMDFGDATFTSFEGNEDWLKCFEQYPEIDPMKPEPGWYIGKIHSHHDMVVFHSGTDDGDLMENAPKLPIFLSLICNYATDLHCKLAIAMEVEETIVTKTIYKLKSWLTSEESTSEKVSKTTPIFTVECEAIYEQEGWFVDQVIELGKRKKPKPYSYTPVKGETKTEEKQSKLVITGKVDQWVMKATIDGLADLFTLGTCPDAPAYPALCNTSSTVDVGQHRKYIAAFKGYFISNWYDETYMYTAITPQQSMAAIREFLKQYENNFITKHIITALDELETEHSSLWPFQGIAVVR